MKSIILISIACATLCWAIEASPIIYTFSGTGSGYLGAAQFSDAAFTITSTADTANFVKAYPLFVVPDTTATIFVSGVGDATFTGPTQNFDNYLTYVVGITDLNENLDIVGLRNPAFVSYDLSSPLSPITGSPYVNANGQYETTAGTLFFSSVSSVTFQADIVPEPSTLSFIGLGSIGLGVWGRRIRLYVRL